MVIEERVKITDKDLSVKGTLSAKALLDLMNHAAGIRAEEIGQGALDRKRTGIAWMIMNWKVQILRFPNPGEELLVRTWSRDYDRVQAYRDFEVLDAGGDRVAVAASVWIAVDPKNESVLRLTPEIMDEYESEPERVSFPGFSFPRYRKLDLIPEKETVFEISEDMIDFNGHVHNSDYLRMLSVGMPENVDTDAFANVEITFRKQIMPGASVRLQYCRNEEKVLLIVREKDGDMVHAILSVW